MMKKITIWCRRLLDWLLNGFVLSKTIFFIWGLVFSYALVKKAVVEVFFGILQSYGLRKWKAIFFVSMLDLVSAVFRLGVTHVSDAYTGRFTVIIFCTGAYAMGLMMLYTYSGLGQLIFAVVLIGFGIAGEEPTFEAYFHHQLSEEVKKKYTTDDNRRTNSHNLWWPIASFAGSVVATFGLGDTISLSTRLQISLYFMSATYLLFFLGVFSYYTEEIPSGSPLTTFYTIIREAINKRRLPYPSSEEGYYSNGNNISEDSFYDRSENGEAHLLPRPPSCLSFLDKAAIIGKNIPDDENEEQRNREACTVEQVRGVKSLYPIIPLGYMLFGYSLVSAAGNTYFFQQAYNLNPYVGDFKVSVVAFVVLKSLFAHGVRTVQSMKRLVKPSRSIAVGMFCSGLCGISAWLVERRRLSLTLKDPRKEEISLSIMVLTPQFILLGLMEAFAEDGLVSLVCPQGPESKKKLVVRFSELLLAIEKNSSLVFAYCFGVLTNESEDTSLLDWYFLFLALLSFGFFVICLCCNSFSRPPNKETQNDDEDEGSNN